MTTPQNDNKPFKPDTKAHAETLGHMVMQLEGVMENFADNHAALFAAGKTKQNITETATWRSMNEQLDAMKHGRAALLYLSEIGDVEAYNDYGGK